ncbi:PqqD family peptide modification chaperone [Butyrivibrio sp. AE3004]|uniref:PqqD family peptide modification chaperone n=1 Tax=Butyrivibrio sp. AE3004 TaxID=1506994 RepID=UPI000493FF23|nr:PqqD family peptide modification chaperone [Butyrivibrio sp. AE3004]
MRIDRKEKISLKKRLKVTDISGEKVMIDFDSGKYFMIKGSGNDIWDMIQDEITVDEIIQNLLNEFEVSEEECEKSVFEFLEKLKEYEFI